MNLLRSIVAVFALFLCQHSIAVAEPASDLAVIYSTFNEEGAKLFGRYGDRIYRNYEYTIFSAMPFQTPKKATALSIDLGVSVKRLKGNVIVTLYKGEFDLPEVPLMSVEASHIPPRGDPCCEVTTVNFDGVVLEPGQWYWVAVKPNPAYRTGSMWHYNNMGVVGRTAYFFSEEGWIPSTRDTVNAFRILGKFD